MPILSRRQFIASLGWAMAGAAAQPLRLASAATGRLGRIATDYLRVHAKPASTARSLGWKTFDQIVPIYDDLPDDDGRLWHDIGEGYILSAEVQPVEDRPNPAAAFIPAAGILAEVTIPFVDARRKPLAASPIAYRLYFSSTIWVRDLITDTDGNVWYKLYDERLGVYYYAPAAALRLIPRSDFSALSPGAVNKRIVVDLRRQRLTAFEGRREVFSTLISSGRLYLAADGVTRKSWTPAGKFTIDRKRPTRHMGYGEVAGSDYELPGVPWVSYFHWTGLSFHGTWWHNDYGRPRSAGCINMRPPEARWLYRWSRPTALPDQEVTLGEGTQVEITEG